MSSNRARSADAGDYQGAVWKLTYNGNYGDIVSKLGQELFQDMVNVEKARELLQDVANVGKARDWLVGRSQQMQTDAGKQLFVETLDKFQNFLQESQLSPRPPPTT